MAAMSPSGQVIVMKAHGDGREEVLSLVEELGLMAVSTEGDGWSAVTIGDGRGIPAERFEALDSVDRIASLTAPYRFASREMFDGPRPVIVRPRAGSAIEVGGTAPIVVMATPTASQHLVRWPEGAVAQIREAGATILVTGQQWSPGGEDGEANAEWLGRVRAACDAVGLALCLEVDDVAAIAATTDIADLLMVAPRNMQNFTLLRELGRCGLPVVLTRGAAATVEEFLLAAEYVLANGNGRVILRESGAGSQGSVARPRFEVNLVPLLKQATHLPVIADPSRATSAPHLVPPVAAAAIAAGADGLVLELDDDPMPRAAEAPLDPTAIRAFVSDLASVAEAVGRRVVEAKPEVFRVPAYSASEAPRAPEAEAVEQPEDVLRPTPLTLSVVIDSIIGETPRLDVLRQSRISGPYPRWLEMLLRPEGDLLVRWTSYMLGETTLTRNLAYVDLGRVDPTLVKGLEAEEVNLGEIFRSQEIDRFGYEFGSGADAGDIDVALRHGHPGNLHPYVWRRYIAATSGRVGFLVIESVPTLTWRRLLRSKEPARTTTSKGVSG
jgi:3-deoxy-7-phosphoheptulonate synthase